MPQMIKFSTKFQGLESNIYLGDLGNWVLVASWKSDKIDKETELPKSRVILRDEYEYIYRTFVETQGLV